MPPSGTIWNNFGNNYETQVSEFLEILQDFQRYFVINGEWKIPKVSDACWKEIALAINGHLGLQHAINIKWIYIQVAFNRRNVASKIKNRFGVSDKI